MRRMKRVISLLLVLAMLINVCPVSVFATTADTGPASFGDYRYQVLEDGTLSISGYTGKPTSDHEGTYLEIPSDIGGVPVVKIEAEAFKGSSHIDTIILPESVTAIGENAFRDCTDLKAIAFLGDVPGLENTLASGCGSLIALYTLKSCDTSRIFKMLEADLGSDGASKLEIYQFENAEGLKKALEDYIRTLDAELKAANAPETTAPVETMTGEQVQNAMEVEMESDMEAAEGEAGAVEGAEGDFGVEIAPPDDVLDVVGPEATAPDMEGSTDMEETEDTDGPGEPVSGGTTSPAVAGGNCGNGLTWVLLNTGELRISGSGAMANYSGPFDIPWYDYKDQITSVEMLDGVTTVGDYAFMECTALERVQFPANLQSIGEFAFAYCSALPGELALPEGLTTIRSSAFTCCTGLTGDLVIPDSVTTIEPHAFAGCSGITGEVVVSNGVAELPICVFSGMSGVTSLVLGENVAKINTHYEGWNHPFFNMTGVREIIFTGLTVPAFTTYSPFLYMTNLETVYVPAAAYNAYVTAYGDHLPETAQIRSIGSVSDDFRIEDGVLVEYLGNGGEVVIPNGVTAIANSVFQNRTDVVRVTISDSVTEIGDYAFAYCTSLEEVNFGENLINIDRYAFSGCYALKSLNLSEKLETLGEGAFYYCEGMTGDLTIPASVSLVGPYCFYYCMGLNGKLTFEPGEKKIGSCAFYNCYNLKELELGDGITEIGQSAFNYCYGMTGDLVIPDSVTKLSYGAFMSCYGFNGTLTLPANLTTMENSVFYGCSNIGGEIVVPDGVTAINLGVFSGMKYITSLVLPANLNYIYTYYAGSDHPFSGMTGVTEVTFTSLVVPTIDRYSPFAGMNNLEVVHVPGETAGDYIQAFHRYLPATAKFRSETIVDDYYIQDGVLISYFGEGGEFTVPEGVVKIGDYAFNGRTNLTGITMPDTVTEIGAYAFQNCSGLCSITLSNSLTSIGNYAFQYCSNLDGLELPDSLTFIGERAFENCTGLTGDLTIPGSVKTISTCAFQNCSGLNGKLTMEPGEKTIGTQAFYNCNSLTGLELGEGITSIGQSAFANCYSITGDLVIPDSVTELAGYTFNGCYGFNGTLTLPANLTTLGSRTFNGCSGITGEIVVPSGVTGINSGVFSGMSKVESLVLGENVTNIYTYYTDSDHPFYNMTSLKEITFLGTTVPTIGRYTPFPNMKALEAVYVPAESYAQYAAAYQSYLPAGARMRVIGASEDFQIENGVLTAYFGDSAEVVIPEGVTTIGEGAFQNCTAMTKVTIPADVTAIGNLAFKGCTGLTEIVFSEGLQTIGNYAFQNCSGLQSLELPDSLTTMGECAFQNSGLTNVVFGDGLTNISNYAFQNCTGLTEVTFSENLLSIGNDAFRDCSGLQSLTLPGNLETIGNYAFANCSGLTGDLTIPASVTWLGQYCFYYCTGLNGTLTIEPGEKVLNYSVFYNCYNLTGLELGEGITTIDQYAFYGCYNITGDLVIPDSVTKLGYGAFMSCYGFNGTLTLPANLTTMENRVFSGCSGITGEIVMPSGITAIGSGVFSGMSKVESLVLSENVVDIYTYYNGSDHPFYGMNSLKEITFLGATVPTINRYSPFYNLTGLETVYVPAEAYEAYAAAYKTHLPANARMRIIGASDDFLIADGVLTGYFGEGGEVVIPEGVTSIGVAAFQNCTTMTKLTLPANVTTIGDSAFKGCTGLTEIVFSEGLQTIGNYAFQNCTNLQTLELPDSLTGLGDYAFQKCSGLTNVVFGDGLTTISNYAFQSCTGLEEITFSENLLGIGNYAFQSCTGLQSLNLPGNLETIGQYAFEGCTGMPGDLTIPSSVKTISLCAFQNCTGLKGKLIIEPGEKTIGDHAFYNCYQLTGLELGEGITTIEQYAFYNCYGITGDLVIPDSVTKIGYCAFFNCYGVNGTLTLPANLTTLGRYAFRNCRNITGELVVPSGITAIDQGVFSEMSKVEMLVLSENVNDIYTTYTDSDHPFYRMNSLTKITFLGTTVPTIDNHSPFANLNALEHIYVPAEAFGNYAVAYGSHLPANARLRSLDATEEFLILNSVLIGYQGEGGEVVIPEGVTAIGLSAFQNCKTLTKVTIPSTVKAIDAYAFKGCTGLTEIVFSEGLQTVGNYAFQNCTGLLSLDLPNSLTSLGEYVFSGCTGLRSATNVANMGRYAFQNCTGLTEVIFSGNLRTIAPYAFNNCAGLKDIHFNDDLVMIDECAFAYCTGLETLVLPGSLETIGDYAFRDCTGLTGGLTVPASVTRIGNYAFYNCYNLNGTLVIEPGTKTIGFQAFFNCYHLTGLELGEGITAIESYAFYNCYGITGDLVIPDSVTKIGNCAFYNCSGFDGTLTLPENLTTLESHAFRNCSNITGEIVVPDGITVMNQAVFSNMSKVTSLVFGPKMTDIYTNYTDYDHAFYNMTGLQTITFNSKIIPTIDRYTPFPNMTSLETIYVPADAYDAYVKAFSGYVGESVVFSTDFLTAKISNLTATHIYSQTVRLTWKPHSSERVIGYRIERNGEVVGTVSECSFIERELTPGVTYTYRVYGYTEEGETTGAAQLQVTPRTPNVQSIRTDNNQNKVGMKNTIYVHVTNSKNLEPLGEETLTTNLYYLDGDRRVLIGEAVRNPALGSSTRAVYTVNWDISTIEDGAYTLLFSLTDVDGMTTEYTETVTVDRSVPAKIVGVSAIGDIHQIYLSWAISAEVDTGIYRIYRRAESDENFRLVTQINNRNTLNYADTNVQKDRIYYYYVVGVNSFGQEGEPSEIAGATLSGDTEAPLVTKLAPANGGYLSGTVNITLTAQDNVSVTRAELYYMVDGTETWNLLAQLNPGNYTASLDTTVMEDGVIRIKGIAYDAAGNQSSPLTYVYSIDNTGPEQVSGLAYESTNVTVTLSWKDVADEDIRFYRVEKKEADGSYSFQSDVYSTLGINIYNLTPETEYTYRVIGYDRQGNRGVPSQDITVKTLGDTTAPVITQIRPTAGYYSANINLSITASDEHNVASILLQTSTDVRNWTDVYTETYSGTSDSRTLRYELNLADYAEGSIYVRAIATDGAGNESDSGVNAPYVQYIVDRTAPGAPENVKATGRSGCIEVSWTQGRENDLSRYAVYRSMSENGPFTLVASGIAATNYIDRNVVQDTVYYYQVTVNDVAGNESGFSAVVSAEVIQDTEAPEIYSVYPESGSKLGSSYKTVSVLAVDNNSLDTVQIWYSADGRNYNTLLRQTDISAYNKTLSVDIPVAEFRHGDTVYVRFRAEDSVGNVCEDVVYTYIIDQEAPTVKSATAELINENVYISWNGNMEEDLSFYRIYRKTGATGSYSLFAQRQAVAGQEAYFCYDSNLSLEKVTYYYKVEAVDFYGNISAIATDAVSLPDRSRPTAVISCESTMEIGVEYIIDGSLSRDNEEVVSYLFDFGDGTTSTSPKPIHVYEQTGEYTITLTVTDSENNTSTTTRTVNVKDRSLVGSVKIRIVDENGVAVPGAPVYFDLGEEMQVIRYTDSGGYATFTADVGKHTVGCIIANNEWLPVKKDVIVRAGVETAVTMTMVHHALIEGHFEISRMTFDEIIAAGIDVSDPENQHIVKINVTLTYTDSVVDLSFNYNVVAGRPVWNGNSFGGNAGSGGGIHKEDKPNGGGGIGRTYVPVVIHNQKQDVSQATIAILDLPIEASFLKEFFDVKLHILNNASTEFSMKDNIVSLNVPEGLSIVDTDGTEGSAVVQIPEIVGQSTETINWILRGDKEGEYMLTADYTGILSEFNERISTKFVAEDPIKVYGLSAVKLIAEVNATINYDAFYFNLAIENVSDIDVYMPSIGITDNIISTYLRQVNEEGEVEESWKKPAVTHLNTVLSNSSGFSQNIGTADPVTTIAPGERMTNKYAVYNVLDYNNILYFRNAVYEIVEGYGVQFELIVTEMDLFNMDNAAEKLTEVARNLDKSSMYYYILGNQNFFYIMESLERDQNFWGLMAEQGYGAAKAILNLDFNYNKDETKEITRKLVAQLMVDESMQQTVSANINTKYLDVTSKTLKALGSILSTSDDYGLNPTDMEIISEILDDGEEICKLSSAMQKKGLEGMLDRFSEVCVSAGISVVLNPNLLYSDIKSNGAYAEALGDAFSKVGDVVDGLDKVFTAWNESAELTSQLMTIAAAEEEAVALLDILLKHTDKDTAIYEELENIQKSLNEVSSEMSKQFITKLTEAAAEFVADKEVEAILKAVDLCYGTSFGVIYTIAKLTFGAMDYIFDWSGSIEDLHVLRVNTTISFGLSDAVREYGLDVETNEQALYTLKSLKYLIKMRLIGEQSFVNIMNEEDHEKKQEALDLINDYMGSSYGKLDEYASDVSAQLLSYRDNIFAKYATKLDIPEAPTVTINYLTSTTKETFDSTYEYSFEGTHWMDGTGSTIAFEPGNVAKRLWVRVKGTDNNVAGNVTKIVIPAMGYLAGDFPVIYYGNHYQISGLPNGTYQYAFTNDRNVETFTGTFTVENGKRITLSESGDWTYLAIQAAATEASFASQIRYLVTEVPEYDWVVNDTHKRINGVEAGTTAEAVITYYSGQGYSVSVTGAKGEEVALVGTGSRVYLDGEAYTVMIQGDVNGDASIDMADLQAMMDHVNYESMLTDVYLEAGCISRNDDIDIFDIYYLMDYISNGYFPV